MKLTSSDHLLQKAFDYSFQANIISIVKDGTIIRANRAACRLFGYSQKELLTKKRHEIFLISELNYKIMLRERKGTRGAKADLTIVRNGGKLRPCEITSVMFKDGNGITNSITSISDGRERLSKQKKIDLQNEKEVADNIDIAQLKADISQAENLDWIKSIAGTSYDVTWDFDIDKYLISFGKSYEKVFGYKLPESKIDFGKWIALFVPPEGQLLERKMKDIQKTAKKNWEDMYQFTCPDGTPGHVIIRANIIRDSAGKATRMMGVIHDISKLQKIERMLKQEMRMKKKQISDAFVEGKETERSDIGKELHDNINQLLGASMLYLDMARKDIKNGERYLVHSSEYTLTAIDEIRKLTKALTTDTVKQFGLCGAIEHICGDIMETYPIKIHSVLDDSRETLMNQKFKLNIFRIFQEQLNNILKHANATVLRITFTQTVHAVTLSMQDNGIGFDKSQKAEGIGISNIISRAESYKGTADFISEPGKGCELVLHIPL